MRIDRLDLIRYGKFTDHCVDFGPRPDAGSDIHVIYGPNEAGKSTLFSAVLDLFFGIEPKSTYNFIHPYPTMQIGAALTFDGRQQVLARVKKAQGSLLDETGQPVSEAGLQGALAGLGRDACRTMFSLDDETLEQGGESILASKGDLGQLLFSASAGLPALSRTLDSLDDELARFHAPNARKTGLAEAKRHLGELADNRKAVDETASAHARRVDDLARAETAYGEVRSRLAVATHRRDTVVALLKASPLQKEREGLVIDGPALAAETAAEALREPATDYRTARADLPNRHAECEAADQEVAGLLRRLDCPEESHPRRLLLPTALAATLKELAARKGAIDATLSAAERTMAEAAKAVEDLDMAEGSILPGAETLARVTAALADVRAERTAVNLRETERQARDLADRLARELTVLSPWSGSVDDLASLSPPSAVDVSSAGAILASAEKALALRQAAAEKAEADLTRQRAALAALGGMTSLVAGADHAAIRTKRESLWALHRHQLDKESADAFEQALRLDDEAMSARLTQANAIARLAEITTGEAMARAEHTLTTAAQVQAESQLASARDTLAALVRSTSPQLHSTISAEALSAWLKRREDALSLARDAHQAARHHADGRASLMALRTQLAGTLAAAGHTPADSDTLTHMEQAADAVLQKAGAMEERHATRARLAKASQLRSVEHADAMATATQWQTAWQTAISSCWLGALTPEPSPSRVMEILERLIELDKALDKRADRHDRLGKMERNMAAFAEEVSRLATRLGMDGEGDGPLEQFQLMWSRVANARATANRRADIDRRLGEIAANIPDMDTLLLDIDRNALEQERLAIDVDCDNLREAELSAFHERQTAAAALAAMDGGPQAALIAAERATVLMELRADSERYLRLRLGSLAVREAIRRYRDEHQSSMLKAASDAFATVSRGAYRRLAAQAIDGTDRLIAIGADGTSKQAATLSKGTRFQLYLALRVAGHREFARQRTPLPFMCDDIMETFDDFRAEEAFRLLGGMAGLGQVIYLTHHRHLCAIAREVCPTVRIHELPTAHGN